VATVFSGFKLIVDGHPLSALLENPNSFYAGTQLWMASIFSWCIAGNAYWLKVRNTSGDYPA
jgi:phage portal protein BeeE